MRYSTLRLWEKVGGESNFIRQVKTYGFDETAKMQNISRDEVIFQVERLRWLNDYERFAEKKLWIINKEGQLVRFIYNNAQRKLNAAIEKQKISGKAVRICLLKARQWGGTTSIEGMIFNDTILRESRSSMIIAHSLESAEHIRSMSERYYDRYDLQKPRMLKKTEKWWRFQHTQNRKPLESSIRIDTAENLGAGHSFTLHNLHCSEIQKWPHAEEIVKGLFPAVPNSSDTMIFFEGTGAGVGSYWYEFCQRAQHEESEWEFVFVPWFEIEDYKVKVSEDEAKRILSSLDDEERALVNMGVTPDYLRWRRREISDTYKGDLDSFHQQYPATPEEAFLTSGRPVFPAGLVKKKYSEGKDGKKGSLVWKEVEGQKVSLWRDDPYGWWEKWEEPVPGENLYVSGADVAEGIAVEPEFGNRGGDFSAARIFRRDTRVMVATFHARVDPDLFADELGKAAFYWKASLLPEQNAGGGGNVVILRLKEIRGVRILKTPIFGKKRDEEKQDEVGWETMKNTKRIMIDEMTEAIREEDYKDLDKVVWAECATYVRDEKGRTNAQPRKYDDLVVATAITLQADKLMPAIYKYQSVPKRVVTPDMDVVENWSRNEGTSLDSVMAKNLVEF